MWSYSKGMVKASLSVLALTSDGYVRMSAEICDAFLDPTKGFDHVKNASIPWPPIPMIFFFSQRSNQIPIPNNVKERELLYNRE